MKKKKKSEAGLAQHARHVLSVKNSTGVELEDAESVTCAKREPRAKRAIQQKHTLSLQRALSASMKAQSPLQQL